MVKNRKYYVICWLALVALFHVVIFTIPVCGARYRASFWIGYGTVMAAAVVHCFSTLYAARGDCEKQVCRTPVLLFHDLALGFIVIVGSICMLVPAIPRWVTILLCVGGLLLSVVLSVTVQASSEYSQENTKKSMEKTDSFRELTQEAQVLVRMAETEEARKNMQCIYDALRYSDPVSSTETQAEETEIRCCIHELDMLQKDSNQADLGDKTKAILHLIDVRNQKCMQAKRQYQDR